MARAAVALMVLAGAVILSAAPAPAPAAASRLETHARKIFDGIAPFADWEPSDINVPKGNLLTRDPGDDFNDQDGFVRTLDTTLFEIEYAVDNPGLPNNVVSEVVTVNGGARIKEDWVVKGCPSAVINVARTQLQCTIAANVFTSSTSTLI